MTRVACIGDSLTWGFSLPDPRRQSYPALLQERLGEDYVVRNFGCNGASVRRDADLPYVQTLAYGERRAWNQNIVLLMLGSNDATPWDWDAAAFRSDYERILDVPDAVCDAVLREAVKKSCNGLIFIDMDDPSLSDYAWRYHRNVEQIRLRLKEMTVEAGGECALVLADVSAPNLPVVEELAEGGVPEFDHTLVFKDFTPDELYGILCLCLEKFDVTFSPAAEKHMRAYLEALHAASAANARTMKLMSRTIYQQVILRESGLTRRPKSHQVQLSDIEMFKWNRKKGRIGY